MTEEKRPVAAFFDFDHTLIDANSGMMYARFERRAGRVTRLQLARVAFWMVLYKLSIIDMDKVYRFALSRYQGESAADLDSRTQTWFHEEIAQRIQPGALEALAYHRAQGHPLVIITSSSIYLARCAAEHYQLDEGIGNSFVLDEEGKFAGDFVAPLCYREGKIAWAKQWAEPRGIDLKDCYFYSDSLSDVPLLEAVGNPRVVNPDFRLRRYARKQQWTILDWRRSEGAVPELGTL